MMSGKIEANCKWIDNTMKEFTLILLRYLVLEYIEGGELFHYIRNNGRLPEDEAVRIFRQMIAGLSYCHRFNICHRDLKPENILMDRFGNIKIVDFGMAALQPANKWLTTSCGSPHYASPEVIQAKSYRGDRADIWSCGIILYAMLSGTLPFDSQNDNHEDVIQLVLAGSYTFPEGLSLGAKDLIWRMLQYDPRQRIPMKKMWEHPLLRHYEGLDPLDSNGLPYIGPVSPLTVNDCGPPIRSRKDLDGELLRNLQNLWHGVPAEEVTQKLLTDAYGFSSSNLWHLSLTYLPRPNHERVLYAKLLKFREEHLENYEGPTMEYSASDYHHVQEPRRRSSTRASLQPPLPNKRHSQYSIITEGVPRKNQSQRHQRQASVPETEQSYDPFRASSKQQIARAETDQARITVLRGSSGASRQRPASIYSRRPPSRTSVKIPALARIQDDAIYSLPGSSSSSGSPQQRKISRVTSRKSMFGNSSAVRKSVSYKRNVSFIHSQRRTTSSNHPTIKVKRETNALTLQERYNQGQREEPGAASRVATPRESKAEAHLEAASPQPEVPQVIRSRKTPSRKPGVPDVILTRASQFWRDDARKVSTELEKFCDEAFNRSSLQLSTTPVTEADDGLYDTPATTLSRELSASSFMQHPQRVRGSAPTDLKTLRERPLPRLPSPEHPGTYDLTQRELAKARELLVQRAADPSMAGSLDEVIAHLDRLMQPSAVRLQEEGRRAASTPDPKSPLERTNDTFERFLEKGYTGIRSASEPVPRPYVTIDRNRATVRIVDAEDQKPISPTKPLTIRKKSGSSTPSSGSGRLRAKPSQEQIPYFEDISPSSGPQRGEYRSVGLNLLDHPLEPIEEDEDKENFDPRDRKLKTLSGDSKKRSWFRRHQQSQGSQGSDNSQGPTRPDGELPHDCKTLQPNVEVKAARTHNAPLPAVHGEQKPSGKGRFLRFFGKRDGKSATNNSKGISTGKYFYTILLFV